MTDALRLLPADDDLDTGGIFAAARAGKLAVRRCNGCDTVLHVPRMYCKHCGSWEGRWEAVDGDATLYSWTVVTHQVHPAYPTPYTVVLVDIDALPGTRFVGRVDGDAELAAGMPMEIWFEQLGSVAGGQASAAAATGDDGDAERPVVVPNWRPTTP